MHIYGIIYVFIHTCVQINIHINLTPANCINITTTTRFCFARKKPKMVYKWYGVMFLCIYKRDHRLINGNTFFNTEIFV